MELIPEEELESFRQDGSKTFADKRARKIARFKRQRAAESKLLEISERRERRGRSTRAAALSTPVEAGEEDILDDDGEEEREAWFTTISLAICKALDLLEMLKKEEEMLSAVKERRKQGYSRIAICKLLHSLPHFRWELLERHMGNYMGAVKDGGKEFAESLLDERTSNAEAWHRDAATRAQYTKPAQPITCATFAQDVLEGRANVSQAHEHKHQPLIFGPASLVGRNLATERERLAAQVFQPTHRLPTMSIEEAGETEMNMMNQWQERTKKFIEEANSSWHNDAPKFGPPREEDEDDDAAVERARALDDWKDENPRGAGNKKLTPCG
ncbi:PP2A regulatory subunit TAP46 [Bienertia sinuspersici]